MARARARARARPSLFHTIYIPVHIHADEKKRFNLSFSLIVEPLSRSIGLCMCVEKSIGLGRVGVTAGK